MPAKSSGNQKKKRPIFVQLLDNKRLKQTRFSKRRLIVFATVFALIGGYIIYRSFALAPPATYYVDQANPSADDTNSGSASLPFKTIQRAANVAAAGDTVIVKAGIYHEQVTPQNSGSVGNLITFKSEPAEQAVVTGDGTRTFGFFLEGKNYIRLDGFTITGIVGHGVMVSWATGGIGSQIVNNSIHDNPNCDYCAGVYYRTSQDGLIEGNHIYNNAGDGIGFDTVSGITIRNNNIHDNAVDGMKGGGPGLVIVEGNTVHSMTSTINHGDCMQLMGMTGTLVVRNNTTWDCTQNIYLDDYSNPAGSTPWGDAYIYNNVVFNSQWTGLSSPGFYNGIVAGPRYNNWSSLSVYNNTLVDLNDGNGGLAVRNPGDQNPSFKIGSLKIHNNIFYNSIMSTDPAVATTTMIDYDAYYNAWRDWYLPGGFLNFDQFRAKYPAYEQNGFYAPISFVKYSYPDPNFHLVQGSAVIDRGVTLTSPTGIDLTHDHDGLTRGQGTAWDIGAYEFSKPSVWVAPTGSDATCIRGDPSKPCASFDKAFQIALGGDIVEVAGGSYDVGTTTIYPNASLTAKVIFRPATGATIDFTNAVQIKASHVQMDDMPFRYANFVAGDGSISHSQGLVIQPPSGSGSNACISDIVIKNADGRAFGISNGVSDVHFIGGSWGNLGWQPGQISNLKDGWASPAIGGSKSLKCPDASTEAAPVANITFDGVEFGNNFQGCRNVSPDPQLNCAEPSHPDCLHVYGSIDGLAIKNSIFDKCFGQFMNLSVESTYTTPFYEKNVLIENNWYGDAFPSAAYTVEIIPRTGVADCTNFVFRNNSFAYQGAGIALGGNCPGTPGTNGIQFYNNIFGLALPTGSSCSTGSPSFIQWDHNIFETGQTCGTNAFSGSVTYVDRTSPDLHLTAGSMGIDQGDISKCATSDIDGDTRPQGTACDIGADEYTSTPSPLASAPPPTPSPSPSPPPPTYKTADLNHDGYVNVFDLSILLTNYSTTNTTADIDHNGSVNIIDLSILLSHYGQ